MKTLGELLLEGSAALEKTSPSARLDATLLLAHAAGISKLALLTGTRESASEGTAQRFHALIARRAAYEPVAYLLGEKEFWGLPFKVSPDVLVPRPETELLVEESSRCLLHLALRGGRREIADLGTGSGCIAIALASELKKRGEPFHITALDRSSAALELAKENAARNELSRYITFIESDWFAALPQVAAFDLVVSNPPYIAEGDRDVSPELRFEPAGALYSGSDGLDAIRAIVRKAWSHLVPGGVLLFECGVTQEQGIRRALNETAGARYSAPAFVRDLRGKTRVVRVARSVDV